MVEMTSHVNAELATVSVAQVTDWSVQDGNGEMLKDTRNCLTLKMKAQRSFETSWTTNPTSRHHIPEDKPSPSPLSEPRTTQKTLFLVAGTGICYRQEGSGFQPQWGRDFPYPSRLHPKPTQSPVRWVPGLFPRGKMAGPWRWPATQKRAEVKRGHRHTSAPPLGPCGMLQGENYLNVTQFGETGSEGWCRRVTNCMVCTSAWGWRVRGRGEGSGGEIWRKDTTLDTQTLDGRIILKWVWCMCVRASYTKLKRDPHLMQQFIYYYK